MVFTPGLLWALIAALIISSIGFKKYVWFISIGYGFSIAGLGAVLLILFREKLSAGIIVCCLLFIAYGFRLGGFLAYREFKVSSYNKSMTGEIKDGNKISFGVKVAIWVTCAILYVLEVSPVLYRLENGSGTDICTWLGAGVMAFGLVFEAIADLQKNQAKKRKPKRFVDTGLFKIVRCPNYLGEMLFWTGVFISGLTTLRGGQWGLALLGYVGIIYVMFSGARRLEIRQNKNYGNDSEYQHYVKTVPIMVPFVPLYSVEKHKWLVA